jgi:hypothetical protein
MITKYQTGGCFKGAIRGGQLITSLLIIINCLMITGMVLAQNSAVPGEVSTPYPTIIFDLKPDTEYEIHLSLKDPDGGAAEKTVKARTRPVEAGEPLPAYGPRPKGVDESTKQ